MAARKNGTVVVEHEVQVEAEKVVADLQTQGEARFNEIVVAVQAQVLVIDAARGEIVSLIRPIRDENLWVFGRNADGDTFTNWKDAVKYILNGAFSHWSKQARSGIVLMLVDEGFTTAEAAEVTEVTPGEAKKAVTEADNEAQGVTPEPAVEATPAEKADKVAKQAIAQNKRVADELYDMSLDSLQLLAIDYNAMVEKVTHQLEIRTAEAAGTSAA